MSVVVGNLVVVKTQPQLGVGRIERIFEDQNASEDKTRPAMTRVFFYDTGTFEVFSMDGLAPVPAGAPRHMELFTPKTLKSEVKKDGNS